MRRADRRPAGTARRYGRPGHTAGNPRQLWPHFFRTDAGQALSRPANPQRHRQLRSARVWQRLSLGTPVGQHPPSARALSGMATLEQCPQLRGRGRGDVCRRTRRWNSIRRRSEQSRAWRLQRSFLSRGRHEYGSIYHRARRRECAHHDGMMRGIAATAARSQRMREEASIGLARFIQEVLKPQMPNTQGTEDSGSHHSASWLSATPHWQQSEATVHESLAQT